MKRWSLICSKIWITTTNSLLGIEGHNWNMKEKKETGQGLARELSTTPMGWLIKASSETTWGMDLGSLSSTKLRSTGVSGWRMNFQVKGRSETLQWLTREKARSISLLLAAGSVSVVLSEAIALKARELCISKEERSSWVASYAVMHVVRALFTSTYVFIQEKWRGGDGSLEA